MFVESKCSLSFIQDDLNLALEAIKGGMAVQKAAAEYGIPSGTLYGRCKKVGIELSKAAQVIDICCIQVVVECAIFYKQNQNKPV